MSLPGRTEVRLYTEVDLNIPTGEPDSTAFCKFGRLRDLDHAKRLSVEMPRDVFSARGHRELNMIDKSERKFHRENILACASGRCSQAVAC